MITEKKLAMLEEMMELEKGTLQENTILADVEEWNSLAKLSLIALLDDEFGKKITTEQIKKFTCVKDILDYME